MTKLHLPKLVRMEGLDLLPVQIAYAFWPETGECLGTITCMGPYHWRVSAWGPDGLVDIGTVQGRAQAFQVLKNQRNTLKEEDGNEARFRGAGHRQPDEGP